MPRRKQFGAPTSKLNKFGHFQHQFVGNDFRIVEFNSRKTVEFISACVDFASRTQGFDFLFKADSLRDISLDVLKVKDTLRSTVNLTFDGRVVKVYHGPKAQERFDNEVRVLRYLELRGCNFVPRLLEADTTELRIVTTSCGSRVDRIDDQRVKELFAELEQYGVRHDDPEARNITYRQSDGRFCIIDFEFATILSEDGPKAAS